MKKLVFMFVAMAAIAFASCNSTKKVDTEVVDTTAVEVVDTNNVAPADTNTVAPVDSNNVAK
jgi:hypothetical protein